MGNCCLPSRFRRTSSAINPKNVTLLLVGLDNSGKTTIAKKLAGEPIDSVVPTVGFSVVSLRQKGCHVSIYDLGGGPQIRDIWPRYYADAHGVIFVTDARDTGRLEESRQVLEKLLRNDQISGKPVLLLANKQDLDGALDEIDIVDRLNLEKLVNEQKCPTLVELCSALHFSKKMDVGIDNGYKWLIRSIIREYPTLNNRVLKDLAKQEEENKVHAIKRVKREEEDEEAITSYLDVNPYIDPFKPVKRILEEKYHQNGVAKPVKDNLEQPAAKIPGLIDEVPDKLKERKSHIHHLSGAGSTSQKQQESNKHTGNSYISELFTSEYFQSDMELLNDVPNHSFKNFLVRPKSSGARLYGVRSEHKRKKQRRKPLRRLNKTGPSPFTDISKDQISVIPSAFGPLGRSHEESGIVSREPEGLIQQRMTGRYFVEVANPRVNKSLRNLREADGTELDLFGGLFIRSKSVPSSENSLADTDIDKKIRHSNGRIVNCFTDIEKPFQVNNSIRSNTIGNEVVLDVNKLGKHRIDENKF